MPSTHLSLHYHLIFSTKNRERSIHSIWRPRLHAFLGGAVKKLDGIPEKIGGTDDHIHVLLGLRATHTLSQVLCDIKSASSEWVHEELGVRHFKWQEGYGAFTVSASKRAEVSRYIDNQLEHHCKQSFQEEYIELLTKSDIPFKEEYLW
ncbi:MAG TPA: IS200/IS605 family transposase [Planctomycetota bacterium]|nr:IS200/IS605 family transposase [Planctomycetota bacterium]